MIFHDDPVSGLPVGRLTDGIAIHQTLYFTADPCFDAGRRILVSRTDAQGTCLVGYDRGDGSEEILAQLSSDWRQELPFHAMGCIDARRNRYYYWHDLMLMALDLKNGVCQQLYQRQEDWAPHSLSLDADGSQLRTAITHRPPASVFDRRDRFNHQREREVMLSRPLSRVLSISTAGAGSSTEWEAPACISHVEASPRLPGLMTFCHEGPWLEVDQRIWGLWAGSGQPWPIYQKDPDWGVGHEFWCADGEHIGYHARYREGVWRHAAGLIRYDNTGHRHSELTAPTQHCHGLAANLFVFDGTRRSGDYLLLGGLDAGDQWSPLRTLARHDASRHHDAAHVHARFIAGGEQVVFISDRRRGLSDIYLIDIPADWRQSLPIYDKPPFQYYWV